MVTATLTSKGQITLPKQIRELLHLRTGDRVEFVVDEGGRAVLKPITKTAREVYGTLHTPGIMPRTSAEMDAAIRRRAKGGRR